MTKTRHIITIDKDFNVTSFCNEEDTKRYLKNISLYLLNHPCCGKLPATHDKAVSIEITPLVNPTYCFNIRSCVPLEDTKGILTEVLIGTNSTFSLAESTS